MAQQVAEWHSHLLQLQLLHRCIIHVIDTDASSKSASGWLEDTSKVQKYVMSDEDYAKRENTYKQYKLMKQKVGNLLKACQRCTWSVGLPCTHVVDEMQEDPEWTAEKELCTRKGIPYQAPKQSAKVIRLCQVTRPIHVVQHMLCEHVIWVCTADRGR